MVKQTLLGVQLREVEDSTREDEPTRVVGATRIYPTDPKDLWNALTQPERIARWFLPISGDLQLGGSYQLEGNAGGKILTCKESEYFEVTWEFSGNVSWVSVRLSKVSEGTQLVLRHEMSKDEASEAHWSQYGPGATGVGWDLSFIGLDYTVASGGAPAHEKFGEKWMASDEAKRVIRESASAWERAEIASGVDTATASKRAKQTIAAYTGE